MSLILIRKFKLENSINVLSDSRYKMFTLKIDLSLSVCIILLAQQQNCTYFKYSFRKYFKFSI